MFGRGLLHSYAGSGVSAGGGVSDSQGSSRHYCGYGNFGRQELRREDSKGRRRRARLTPRGRAHTCTPMGLIAWRRPILQAADLAAPLHRVWSIVERIYLLQERECPRKGHPNASYSECCLPKREVAKCPMSTRRESREPDFGASRSDSRATNGAGVESRSIRCICRRGAEDGPNG